MGVLLALSRQIDRMNESIGKAVYWLVLISVLISSGNAVMRYTINYSSNSLLEIQWYLFSAVFLLCAPYTLLRNEHIRIDVVVARFGRRTLTWIDIFGTIFFLLPMTLIIMYLSWPMFWQSFASGERSGDAGGLIRWPAKILVPIGFALLSLQGLSELIKRIAFLKGMIPDPIAEPVDPALIEAERAAEEALR
ncbi:MAG: TRAP transporter small permease subunit [Alphaproteobacteria bacterium]|jgi:TRAP-type mannitol/chloroaromatic compound transport system permease small subunit|nr:TRAP transporter small permease subunit [Alphaproteobacteria bacterium]